MVPTEHVKYYQGLFSQIVSNEENAREESLVKEEGQKILAKLYLSFLVVGMQRIILIDEEVKQGKLTETEGSIPLTSLLRLLIL